MTARLLAFDTSTERMSLALCSGSQSWVREAVGGAQASARLIPELMDLLAEAGCSLSSLDAIAFGCGPGAFTGLRTACSVAQGLALGAGKPVLPIDSLMLVAEDARAQEATTDGLEIWVAMDARMGEIYAAAYRRDSDATPWQTQVAPALYAVEALQQRWQTTPPAIVAGSALALFQDRLALPASTRQLPETQSRAAALVRLAPLQWAQGAAVDAALALPIYLRDKVAQTMDERAALRATPAHAS